MLTQVWMLQIGQWLEKLAKKKPYFEVKKIGNKTYEKRNLHLFRINKAGRGKPNVVIQAGAHAREWISIATCLYLIEQLTSSKAAKYINELNFHIVPVLNPDGYEYSRTPWNRYWRKNRNPNKRRNNWLKCKGVDLNRNWSYHWGGMFQATIHFPKVWVCSWRHREIFRY